MGFVLSMYDIFFCYTEKLVHSFAITKWLLFGRNAIYFRINMGQTGDKISDLSYIPSRFDIVKRKRAYCLILKQ